MSAVPDSVRGYCAVAEWDRDLSREEVWRLSPRDKDARTNVSLKRKVDANVAAASTRPGTGLQGLPGTMAALCALHCPESGMYRLRDRQALRRPENAKEVDRFKAANITLRAPKPRAAMTPEDRVAELQATCDALRQEVARMVKELATRAPSLDQIRR